MKTEILNHTIYTKDVTNNEIRVNLKFIDYALVSNSAVSY
jgi:hypothetical protein